MMNKRVLVLLTTVLLVTGCKPAPHDPLVSQEVKLYEVVGVHRPKHFMVDLREVGTGYVFKRQYVTKHCNQWRRLQIGSKWHFVEVVRQGKNSKYSKLEGVRELCARIQ